MHHQTRTFVVEYKRSHAGAKPSTANFEAVKRASEKPFDTKHFPQTSELFQDSLTNADRPRPRILETHSQPLGQEPSKRPKRTYVFERTIEIRKANIRKKSDSIDISNVFRKPEPMSVADIFGKPTVSSQTEGKAPDLTVTDTIATVAARTEAPYHPDRTAIEATAIGVNTVVESTHAREIVSKEYSREEGVCRDTYARETTDFPAMSATFLEAPDRLAPRDDLASDASSGPSDVREIPEAGADERLDIETPSSANSRTSSKAKKFQKAKKTPKWVLWMKETDDRPTKGEASVGFAPSAAPSSTVTSAGISTYVKKSKIDKRPSWVAWMKSPD